MVTYDAYRRRASHVWSKSRGRLRRGQVAFNVLHTVNPYLALKITGTRRDPYYDDARLPEFYRYVAENWYLS